MNKLFVLLAIIVSSCGGDKNEYRDNTPTSGKLKVYYEEGVRRHVENQAYTFEVFYEKADVELHMSSEADAIMALLNDSCEAIVISRLPGQEELKIFKSRKYSPGYSAVAKSGIAFISNIDLRLDVLDSSVIQKLFSGDGEVILSDGTKMNLKIVFDKGNSSVIHYVKDSIVATTGLSGNCNALTSTPEAINYVAQNKNIIGVIDYAWLSDRDDSLNKANSDKIKFLAIKYHAKDSAVYPNQSSFKTGDYPFTRTVYVMRKTGDFTLAKGFESFVAGPKGQVTFLKQGLLPIRQQERMVNITLEK